jgi:adenosylcobinamide-GDP ribazoletransferase
VRDAIRLAAGTLTAVPTPPPTQVGRRTAGAAMLLSPLTALPLVAVAVLAHLVVAMGAMPALVAAVVVLLCTAGWSRGLHLDGLADTVDGLSAGSDHERSLDVMRRGDVGPLGVVAVVLVLLLQFGALATLLPTRRGVVLVVLALLASRYVLAWGCWQRVPSARPTGLGATVAGSVSTVALVAASSIALGIAVAVPLVALAGGPWYAGPLVVAGATLGGAWVVSVAVRRLGGVTGDVLGACVEVGLAAALLVASLLV